jgi:uncharacterized repeat protein (TIGR04002 family)
MKNKHLRNIILSAVFAAMICVATAFLPKIEIGTGGYVHIGDTFIYLAASMLPLPYVMLAGAVGASLADVLAGYPVWAPATFAIKALMALPFSSSGAKFITARNAAASVGAGLICTAGYYLFESVFISSFAAALASAPFNLIQGLASMVLYLVVGYAFDRLNLKTRLAP